MNKFTLFGERCSGTNFLVNLLTTNGLIEVNKFGFKHWFLPSLQLYRPPLNNSTDVEHKGLPLTDPLSDETVFIVIARNPYQWVASMYNTPHQMSEMKYDDRYSFLTNPYYCSHPTHYKKNPFIEEAKNIIDIRNKKHTHWMYLKNIVKHFYIISYDNLVDDIKKLPFKLELNNFRLKNDYELSDREIKFIDSNLNNEIDKMLF